MLNEITKNKEEYGIVVILKNIGKEKEIIRLIEKELGDETKIFLTERKVDIGKVLRHYGEEDETHTIGKLAETGAKIVAISLVLGLHKNLFDIIKHLDNENRTYIDKAGSYYKMPLKLEAKEAMEYLKELINNDKIKEIIGNKEDKEDKTKELYMTLVKIALKEEKVKDLLTTIGIITVATYIKYFDENDNDIREIVLIVKSSNPNLQKELKKLRGPTDVSLSDPNNTLRGLFRKECESIPESISVFKTPCQGVHVPDNPEAELNTILRDDKNE